MSRVIVRFAALVMTEFGLTSSQVHANMKLFCFSAIAVRLKLSLRRGLIVRLVEYYGV